MTRARRDEIVDVLRQRIVRALATGSVCAGDRLASTREMAVEMHADPRVVSAAYAKLSAEGLVELRARSGVYVRADAPHARRSLAPPLEAVVEILTQAGMRGYPAPQFVDTLANVVSCNLPTVVLATTADQGLGITRELREDFGLDATPVLVDRLRGSSLPPVLRKAALLVTTKAHTRLIESLSNQLRIKHIVLSIRSDLFESEWSLWHGEPVHVVVLDARFRRIVQTFLRESGAESAAVRVHLASADLSRIPTDAPTYVTQAARTYLGKARVPGMIIPPTRLFAEDCVRAVWRSIGEVTSTRA